MLYNKFQLSLKKRIGFNFEVDFYNSQMIITFQKFCKNDVKLLSKARLGKVCTGSDLNSWRMTSGCVSFLSNTCSAILHRHTCSSVSTSGGSAVGSGGSNLSTGASGR